jgi:LysR family glycine cleavage system transcriptional activator
MTFRIPSSVAGLRAFEAAARHSSYSKAAQELSITHGAVSHQIRQMEDAIGAKLFARNGNRMEPTAEGRALLVKVVQALSLLEDVFRGGAAESGARRESSRVRVSAVPSFASRWLLPRLPRFAKLQPRIDIHLIATQTFSNLVDDGVDVAVRYGYGGWQDFAQRKLFHETLFPVAAPDTRVPQTAAELARAPLLRCTRQPWLPWFLAAGFTTLREPRSGLTFDDMGLAIEAATQGQGIALARESLVAAELEEKRLHRLFSVGLEDARAYWVLWKPGSRKARPVEAFVEWLSDEARDAGLAP